MRVVWLSANLFGYELLKESLKIDRVEIIVAITLSSKSKTKMYDGIDKKRWYELGLPVYEIEDINEEKALLKSLRPDILIMCGWRQIIREEILHIPVMGVIGFHPTLLPKGRGPAPIINTILRGIEKSGVTMFYVGEGLDDGDIIGQVGFTVDKDDYAIDIYNKVIEAGRTLIKKYLPLLVKGVAPRVPQNELEAVIFPKVTLADNEITLADSIETANRKIRAFSKPYLGAFIQKENKKIIIWRGEFECPTEP